jgi:hypothetical protein
MVYYVKRRVIMYVVKCVLIRKLKMYVVKRNLIISALVRRIQSFFTASRSAALTVIDINCLPEVVCKATLG